MWSNYIIMVINSSIQKRDTENKIQESTPTLHSLILFLISAHSVYNMDKAFACHIGSVMPITFYPHLEDAEKGSLDQRIELLMEGAERFKAVVLDEASRPPVLDPNKRLSPREQTAAFNWDEIAKVLHGVRELPEATKPEKLKKADLLAKLADVYEVLRSAKMSKLEAVRLALLSEVNQLRGGG